MKVVRTAAHARNTAPLWAVLSQIEILKLRQLPCWARDLFHQLIYMSDFRTGLVSTSYAQLIALLDCDQPPSGPRYASPTLKQVRTALDWLNAMGLAWRDVDQNEAKGELKIFVVARKKILASAFKQGREQGRVKKAQNPDEQRKRPDVVHRTGQGTGQVYQVPSVPSAIAQKVDNLSTGKVRERLKKVADEMRKTASARGTKMAPPGGQSVAPAGHAPEGAKTIGAVLDDLMGQAPPRGQGSAPGGARPPAAARAGKARGDPKR